MRIEEESVPSVARPDVVAERAAELLAPFDLQQMRAAERQAERFGVELRRPFRDRRMVELFLGLPARWLYRPDRYNDGLTPVVGDCFMPLFAAAILCKPDDYLGVGCDVLFLSLWACW